MMSLLLFDISGDWHRYNLKRKVAQLPVVSADAFEQRKSAHENEAKIAEKNSEKNANYYCVACGKNFKNLKAYNNHLQSKKHLEMIMKFDKQPPKFSPDSDEDMEDGEDDDEDLEIEEVDSDEWEEDEEEYNVNECLFCGYVSSSLEKNLRHMTIEHSFFLPDPEYISDLEGLIQYLGAKVSYIVAIQICISINVFFLYGDLSYLEIYEALYFVEWMSIFKIKFRGVVLVVTVCM